MTNGYKDESDRKNMCKCRYHKVYDIYGTIGNLNHFIGSAG